MRSSSAATSGRTRGSGSLPRRQTLPNAHGGWTSAIPAVSEASEHVAALDYEGKRQVLIDLGVQVAVYPEAHESDYHWLMWAFERKDDGNRYWLDGEPAKRQSLPCGCAGYGPCAPQLTATGRCSRCG